MFRFIRNLFGDTQRADPVSKSSRPAPVEVEKSPPVPSTGISSWSAPILPAEPTLDFPFQIVADKLPPALRTRLNRPPARTDLIKLPLRSTLEQLARGAVKISFGALRASLPRDLFSGGAENDASPIELPLAEVLSRLPANHLQRRPAQKSLPIPEGVPMVFSSKPNSPASAPQSNPIPGLVIDSPRDELSSSRVIASPALSSSSSNGSIPFQFPSAPRVAAPLPRDSAPALPVIAPRLAAPARSEPTASPSELEAVRVPLVSVARNWADPMRREIMATNLAASVCIPFAELEAAMKRGKATFTWKQIRLWITPKGANAFSEHDAVSLEMPLAVLTPLFMARRATTAAPKRLQAREEIPDVFLAKKPEDVAAAPNGLGVPAAAPIPASSELRMSPVPQAEAPRSTPATKPAQLDTLTLARSSALPTEIVQKACQLGGVAGALLATPDGLSIASQLPPGLKPETAAAFLPQILGRLSQLTREMKLGDPSHVEMVVGQIPLQIIKTSSVYLAVLGKSGEPLPKAQLIALANQLSQPTH